jgi:FkbM family methyltransferase
MSMRLARRVGPTGRVLMAEPDPRIHALAIENLALNSCGNVETRQAAAVASRQSRTITFHRHPNFWNSGLNRPGASSSPVEVPAVYPPDLVPRDWPGRKVLQCDIEGYEAELLAIAEVVAPFECIIVECHFGNTPETGASPFVAMWRSLVDCGFALADIDTFTFVFSKNAAALDTQASAEKAQTHEP